MFDPSVGRWLQVDPSFFEGGDSNLYRYAGNDPTNATDPSGLVANPLTVAVLHPWEKNRTKEADTPLLFWLSMLINPDNTLTIYMTEGPDFEKFARGFPFDAVVSGAHSKGTRTNPAGNSNLKDTDSFQVAVRWLDNQDLAQGNDVGHETNARAQGKRPVGAQWKFSGKAGQTREATWTTDKPAPKSAVRVDVIVLYTDVIAAPGKQDDLSLIVGSFTATRKDAKTPWAIKSNDKEVFRPIFPFNRQSKLLDERDKRQEETEKTLKDKTGYELQHREPGNTDADTGYDIKQRP